MHRCALTAYALAATCLAVAVLFRTSVRLTGGPAVSPRLRTRGLYSAFRHPQSRVARLRGQYRSERSLEGSIQSVNPGSPDANKTELFGDAKALRKLLDPEPPLDDVPSFALGSIALVGSGPGDPQLLTIAAHRMLEDAEVVICDRLVSKDIRNIVKGELKVAKKYPGCADYAQMEIYKWIAQGLREGKRIVRLKIGDPFIFGRGAEEVLEVKRLTGGRITPSVVPGVSSVFAAPLLGAAALTHRGVANNVILGTGYGRNKSQPAIVPYQDQTTAVFLMAIGRIRELCSNLIEAGYPELTPLLVIEKASCADQRVLLADLTTAGELVEGHKIKPPATIVVGEAARVLFPSEDYPQGLVAQDRLPIDTDSVKFLSQVAISQF
ncbi:hypothetical protein AAMO2058_001504800 [Amorphochlora amoebiformis]